MFMEYGDDKKNRSFCIEEKGFEFRKRMIKIPFFLLGFWSEYENDWENKIQRYIYKNGGNLADIWIYTEFFY